MLFSYIIFSLYHPFLFLEWWLLSIYTLYMNERMYEWKTIIHQFEQTASFLVWIWERARCCLWGEAPSIRCIQSLPPDSAPSSQSPLKPNSQSLGFLLLLFDSDVFFVANVGARVMQVVLFDLWVSGFGWVS